MGGAHGEGVGQAHVPVQARHPDGIVRRHGVDPLVPWQFAAPLLVVPVAAGDPRAFRQRFGECGDALRELGRRACIAQLHRAQLVPAIEQMDMRINEAGRDHLPVCIQRLDAAQRAFDRRAAANQRNPVATQRNGFRPRLTGISGPDARIHDPHRQRRLGWRWGWRRCGWRGQQARHEQRNEQPSIHESLPWRVMPA